LVIFSQSPYGSDHDLIPSYNLFTMEREEVGYISEASGKSERSLDLRTPTVEKQAIEEI